MEVLKVLVFLLVAVYGSLSTPINSQNELRVIVGELERLAESLGRYVVDGSGPEYSMTGKDSLSGSTPEFPIPGTRPLGPWGLDNDDLDPSSPTYKWLYKMSEKLDPSSPTYKWLYKMSEKLDPSSPTYKWLYKMSEKLDPSSPTHKWLYKMSGKLVKPYFRSFPIGPYSSEMPLTPRDVAPMLNAWYNNADQKMLKEQTFWNIARQLLDAHFQCATTRINQIVFYVFKDQVRRMSEDDWKMTTHVMKVFGNWITDTAVVDEVTQTIVMAARRQAYGDIMEHIEYFQVNDIVEFLAKMNVLTWKAEQEKWTPVVFDEKLNQLLTENGIVFQCPSMHDLWEFHPKIVRSFQERLSEIKPFAETEAWLNKVLSTYMDTEATPATASILPVYMDYVKSAMLRFQEVENHVISRNTAQLTKFLAPQQLQYLQSIFEFLNSGNISHNMEMGPLRNELNVVRRPKNRCTKYNGKC